ncbi:Myosin-6 [Bagarius yarrelli]|uniref:Myosin-6 n=1 Tax=Bagarius yarrelli TaxID=175774 RepID=A0A556TP64_BAGYA|nr:Myosin-6 [Bagarius yarrelli]
MQKNHSDVEECASKRETLEEAVTPERWRTTLRFIYSTLHTSLPFSLSNAAAAALDNEQCTFDKMIAEWSQKCEKQEFPEGMPLTHDEGLQVLDSPQEQLSEGGISVHELQRAKKKLEVERDELELGLEEEDTSLEYNKGVFQH